MLNLPFNHNLQSALPVERIQELNTLALRAQMGEKGLISEGKIIEDYLVIETCGMLDVYADLSEFDTNHLFYTNIDAAFKLLLENRPNDRDSIFITYTDLTTLFRTIAKQQVFIDRKWKEANQIIKDIDTLEAEGFKRKRGVGDHV
jgi:hypothetical protein